MISREKVQRIYDRAREPRCGRDGRWQSQASLDSTWTWVGGMIGGFFSDALLSRTKNYRISRTFPAPIRTS
jgi:hypothetical protein